ncbi:hypothetical protein FQN57_007517 [Myotisia sp. PD_48]|nr:hypothetical protein FQN57_007517 [Myotisia sp. PD_48]
MAQQRISQELLQRAHSPDTAEQLFAEKIKHKPLYLRPASPTPADNRSRRRLHRLRKKEYYLRKQKPKPLSARDKRALCIHKLPKEEVKYDIFKHLNQMWIEYMWDVLDQRPREGRHDTTLVSATNHGSKLASADFHGAEVEVVRSHCVSRVGVKGIVVRDSKFVFVLVTEQNEMKTIPKEQTVFRFEIPVPHSQSASQERQIASGPPHSTAERSKEQCLDKSGNLVFELHGSQFQNRAPDRASKKFKWKNLEYL